MPSKTSSDTSLKAPLLNPSTDDYFRDNPHMKRSHTIHIARRGRYGKENFDTQLTILRILTYVQMILQGFFLIFSVYYFATTLLLGIFVGIPVSVVGLLVLGLALHGIKKVHEDILEYKNPNKAEGFHMSETKG